MIIVIILIVLACVVYLSMNNSSSQTTTMPNTNILNTLITSQPSPVQSQPSPVQSQPSPVQSQPSPAQSQPSPVQSQPSPVQSQPSPVQSQPSPVQSQLQPAFINLVLEGGQNQQTIKLKFRSKSSSSDLSWNIRNQEFTVNPNSYIYIGSVNTPSIPSATKLKASNNPIKYELRGFAGEIISSTGVAEFVSIFMVNNNYVIRPNISGNDLFNRTGMVGEWPFTIMAS